MRTVYQSNSSLSLFEFSIHSLQSYNRSFHSDTRHKPAVRISLPPNSFHLIRCLGLCSSFFPPASGFLVIAFPPASGHIRSPEFTSFSSHTHKNPLKAFINLLQTQQEQNLLLQDYVLSHSKPNRSVLTALNESSDHKVHLHFVKHHLRHVLTTCV